MLSLWKGEKLILNCGRRMMDACLLSRYNFEEFYKNHYCIYASLSLLNLGDDTNILLRTVLRTQPGTPAVSTIRIILCIIYGMIIVTLMLFILLFIILFSFPLTLCRSVSMRFVITIRNKILYRFQFN